MIGCCCCFFLSGFSFTNTDDSQDTGQHGKGEEEEDHLLFHSTTSNRSRTLRHSFATLHVRWLSHIFNRIACIYQTATRWGLPPYRITIWHLIDWWCDIKFLFVYVMISFQLFCYSNLRRKTGGFKLVSTINLVLQANRLTKCASLPNQAFDCL